MIDSWVRFEDPGKLHLRRWHRVRNSPSGVKVTLCGRYLHDDVVTGSRGVGHECGTCRRVDERAARGGGMPHGGHY